MKLKVGMYVRLVNDVEDIVVINKIANVFETTILTENDGSIYQGEYTKENVVKASYNIIDILEVGDYVNGYKIGYIDDCEGAMRQFYYDYENPNDDVGHWEEEIKSVITHEQIEQMEYRIGEYETEERAFEVLDEIQTHIATYDYQHRKESTKYLKYESCIYEMPEK